MSPGQCCPVRPRVIEYSCLNQRATVAILRGVHFEPGDSMPEFVVRHIYQGRLPLIRTQLKCIVGMNSGLGTQASSYRNE